MSENRGEEVEMKRYLLVSACLAGRVCRYDGRCFETEFQQIFERIEATGRLIAVCPEVLGGLPTPRESSEILGHIVITRSGTDLTSRFKAGALQALQEIGNRPLAAAVLKSRSPSCGCRTIYDGTFTSEVIEGSGIFADMLRKTYPDLPVYDELEIERITSTLATF
jgi:uncharacterized protein YbbK (DUF523 family)